MTSVFIGGSRNITRLPSPVAQRLDNIIAQEMTILVGDANGADKCVQRYLADKKYEKVVVYCIEGACRNNIGSWEAKPTVAPSSAKGFNLYKLKDEAMTQAASYGFMLWDAKSAGTLNNIINLLKLNKKTLVYFSPEKTFYTISDYYGLSDLLNKCDIEDCVALDKKLNLKKLLEAEQVEFAFA
jgi:hypothetical protein